MTALISSLCFLPKISPVQTQTRPTSSISSLCFPPKISPIKTRRFLKPLIACRRVGQHCCCSGFKNDHNSKKYLVQKQDNNWRILKRWDVPWSWQTISFTSLACELSFFLPGTVDAATVHYTGIKLKELSLDQRAQLWFLNSGITAIVALGVLYSLTKSFTPLHDDIYRYDWRDLSDLKKGSVLWAGVGLGAALVAIAALTSFYPLTKIQTHGAESLLQYIGSSTVSTACMVGISGVICPILEETIFRGFFMASLTKWFPTPLAVIISAFVFTVAHPNHGNYPHIFILGIILGFSYAQTRNLLTPIMLHGVWNSAVTLLVAFLKQLLLQG